MRLLLLSMLLTIVTISNSLSTTVKFDLRSSESDKTLNPDSIVVYNKLDGNSYTFVGTKNIDFNLATNIEFDKYDLDLYQYIKIYTYNGILISKLENFNRNSNSKKIFEGLESGVYFIEVTFKNGNIAREAIYIDANNKQINQSNLSLTKIENTKYDITFYKNGYENYSLYDFDKSTQDVVFVLLTPAFNKFYDNIIIEISGIELNSKITQVITENNNEKHSTYESFSLLELEIDAPLKEYDEYDINLFNEVTENTDFNTDCNESFPITQDSIYTCGLECKQNDNIVNLLHINIEARFSEDKDSLLYAKIKYSDGKKEYAGNPSKYQTLQDLVIYLKPQPLTYHESDSNTYYSVEILGQEVINSISSINWKKYSDQIGLSPPFTRVQMKTVYDNKPEQLDGRIRIDFIKNK